MGLIFGIVGMYCLWQAIGSTWAWWAVLWLMLSVGADISSVSSRINAIKKHLFIK